MQSKRVHEFKMHCLGNSTSLGVSQGTIHCMVSLGDPVPGGESPTLGEVPGLAVVYYLYRSVSIAQELCPLPLPHIDRLTWVNWSLRDKHLN